MEEARQGRAAASLRAGTVKRSRRFTRDNINLRSRVVPRPVALRHARKRQENLSAQRRRRREIVLLLLRSRDHVHVAWSIAWLRGIANLFSAGSVHAHLFSSTGCIFVSGLRKQIYQDEHDVFDSWMIVEKSRDENVLQRSLVLASCFWVWDSGRMLREFLVD